MGEAVREKPKSKLEKYADIDSLPVIDDPLPIVPKKTQFNHSSTVSKDVILAPMQSNLIEDVNRTPTAIDSVLAQPAPISESVTNVSSNITYSSYATLAASLSNSAFDESKSCGANLSSAPPLIASSILDELNCEYSLPHSYTLDELKNFYSNQSTDMVNMLEDEFVEETSCYSMSTIPLNDSGDLTLITSVSASWEPQRHPLQKLIIEYFNNLSAWQSSREGLERILNELSDAESRVWRVEKMSESLKGRCRDGNEVVMDCGYETAGLDATQIEHLGESQKALRQHLFENLSAASFKVATSRLAIESYLSQVLKRCPSYETFVLNEPAILLLDQEMDPEMERQIEELRSVTTILFACLRQVAFKEIGVVESPEVPRFEVIDTIIEWIMCIAGRLVRQCRLRDHVYIAMQLLRIPFSLSYRPANGSRATPLCALLQPPTLDLAWGRAIKTGDPLDFLSEPEVEVRGTLLALCLKPPVKRFNLYQGTIKPGHSPPPVLLKSDGGKQFWTFVDSDGESDAECLSVCEKSDPASNLRLDLDVNQVDVETVSCLIDQVDMLGLMNFLFDHCNSALNNQIVLFAFANWLITTLEDTVGFLHSSQTDSPRFQRQIVKRVSEVIEVLLRGLRSRIELVMAANKEPSAPGLYPELSEHESAESIKVSLAQYDELCLRVTGFLLSNAASVSTRLTCWRRFARMSPLHLFSSRSKLTFYLSLMASISPEASDVEGNFWEKKYATLLTADETVKIEEDGTDELSTVLPSLRTSLIDLECLADSFLAAIGDLASKDCRPPPPLDIRNQKPQVWLAHEIPLLEKMLVNRILDILFRLCVVPSLPFKGDRSIDPHRSISSTCGRRHIVAIISAHPRFAFAHLLKLVIASAIQIDTKSSASESVELLLDLVDALPLTLFTPSTDVLHTLLSWVGADPSNYLPLSSLRSQIGRRILNNFPWEGVNNATGEYLISPKAQSLAAIAVASAFQHYILDANQQPIGRISEALNSYARSVLPKRYQTPRRSNSLSPPRIVSTKTTHPHVPLDMEVASLYHWSIRFILRLHLKPSSDALSRLLKVTDRLSNPLTAFLIVEFQHRQPDRPPLAVDEDVCAVLLDLATSGHFALAIEAFSRLSVGRGTEKPTRLAPPCAAFKEFVFLMLKSNEKLEDVGGGLVSYLWDKWGKGWQWRLWVQDQSKPKGGETTAPEGKGRGSVLEAFLGATMNASIGCAGEESEKNCLLQAVISSTLTVLVKEQQCQEQATWVLEELLKTAFWVEKSFPTKTTQQQQRKLAGWWRQPVVWSFHPSVLSKMVEEESPADPVPGGSEVSKKEAPVQGVSSLMSSSWAEGLSNLVPVDGLKRYLPATFSSDPVKPDLDESVSLGLIRGLLQKASRDQEGPFWLVSYLIGAECTPIDAYGGYSLWDDVLDSITWNRGIILAKSASFGPSRDACDAEKCIIGIFVDAGILPSEANVEHLGKLMRFLPLLQSVSALVACPLQHPAFFLLLQLALTHCLAFSRNGAEKSTNPAEACFPPGFLLLRSLQWDRHNLCEETHAGSMRLTVLDAFLWRLKEALQFWLKRDSQDDAGDPYGLCSSSALSLLRMSINLLSDLQHTVTHRSTDALTVNTMLERVKALDVGSALRSVSLDSIASSIYSGIDRWHYLRGTHRSLKERSRPPKSSPEVAQDRSVTSTVTRRLDPPNVQLLRFDEASLHGPQDLQTGKWYTLVQSYTESLKNVAAVNGERDAQLEKLHRRLREDVLPKLYKHVECHRSEVVECQPFLQIPVLAPRSCKGGARISHDYRTARKDPLLESKSQELNRSAGNIIGEVLASSQTTAGVTTLTYKDSMLESIHQAAERPLSNDWVNNAFRLVSILQRIVDSRRRNSRTNPNCSTKYLINIFHLISQSTSASVYAFPPTRAVISQCVDMIGESLLSAGECRYEVILDVLTSSPHLQLFSHLWPRLLKASLKANPECRVEHFMAVYRRLPLLMQNCGPEEALSLLNELPPLLEEKPEEGILGPSSPVKGPGLFGGAAQLDALVLEAFQCLAAVGTKVSSSPASDSLSQLIREQLTTYLEFNFPLTLTRLLDAISKSKATTTQEELWHLAKLSITRYLSVQKECNISTDDVRTALQRTTACASSAADSCSLSSSTKSDIIECHGALIQQLALKLGRAVELQQVSLHHALSIMMANILNGPWSRAIGLNGPTDGIPESAVRQLVGVITILYSCKELVDPPQLFNAFIDSLMTRLFCKPSNLSGLHLLDKVTQACSTLTASGTDLPKGFPWSLWQPSTAVLSGLTQYTDTQPQTNGAPGLLVMVNCLSLVCWNNPASSVHLVEHSERLLALLISLVCWYDTLESKKEFDTFQVSMGLRRIIGGCRGFFSKHHAFARLSTANLDKMRSRLQPSAITNASDFMLVDFFRLLSLVAHMEESADTPDTLHERQAFVRFCIDLILCPSPSPNTTPLSPESPTSSTDFLPADGAAIRTASQVYSILFTSVLPAARSALGAVVSGISSSGLWKQVFGARHSPDADIVDAFESLVTSEAPIRGLVWRVLSLLSDLEACCATKCWDPVDSENFREVVGYCEEVLRLRSLNVVTGGLMDASLVYWLSGGVSTSVRTTENLLRAVGTAMCRPLLQALLYDLSSSCVSTSSSEEGTAKNQAALVNLIDRSLWLLLQTGSTPRDETWSVPADLETRISLISGIFECDSKCGLPKSGAWLVPACLACKKLLPLYVHALVRSRALGPRPPSAAAGILLADLMHWFVVLDLSPSDVCSESCTTSSQLTGLLLIINLSMRLLTSIKPSNPRVPQADIFIANLQALVDRWEKSARKAPSTSGNPQTEVEFSRKFCATADCMIALVEAWKRDSLTMDYLSERLVKRTDKTGESGGEKSIASAIETLLTRLQLDSIDDGKLLLSAFAFLVHQFWSPLPLFLDTLLSSSSPTSP